MYNTPVSSYPSEIQSVLWFFDIAVSKIIKVYCTPGAFLSIPAGVQHLPDEA